MCLVTPTTGQTITCKAAVAWGPKAPLVIEEIQVEPPQAQEVRIKITHTSLCHSDVTFWEAPVEVFPRIFGHEAAGIVESVGEGVLDLKPGDHVIPVFTGECRNCKYCKSPRTNICANYAVDALRGTMKSDGRTRFSIQGKPIFHFMGTSTFSEYTVVDQAQVVKVDPTAPLDKICLLGCGIATGIGAVWKTAKVEAGASVAVFGLGAVGLAVIAGAKIAGASRIIAVDLNPAKFAKAKVFGATDFLNPKEHDKAIQCVIQEMTGGGVDYSFECVGNTSVMRSAYESCQPGWGKSVIVGVDGSNKMLEINPLEFFSGRIWTASVFGGFKCKSDLPDLVDKYMSKELEYDEMITHTRPFSRINEAFSLLQKGESLRCVIEVEA
ncbi:hypothetical protein SELMODRAFT_109935 [Selaginella moellendorffii]|uniref:Enoyl reductase (ER) domain-containing protein n=1 Tax=Selaginella moellendorffii TaxID=88036 RepID=D8S6X2_SELML|nr:hypothetical protein SELMODRAFT_109935 [Selaginella moellendorffii]